MTFRLANGVAILRNGPLPSRLGWVAVVLWILGPLLGARVAALWILISSIVILVRASRPSPAPAA